MFGVDSSEFLIIILVAVVVIGPKELPRVMRTVGQWVGKARGMANQFRSGVDQMVRDSEIADLERKWREQNEAIMKANPMAPPDSDWGQAAQDDSADARTGTGSDAPVSLDKPAMLPLAKATLEKPSPEKAPPTPTATASTRHPDQRRRPAAPSPLRPAYPAPRGSENE